MQNGRLFQIRAAKKGDTNARFTRRIAPSHITQLEALTMWCHSSVPQTNCIRTVREYHRMISATEIRNRYTDKRLIGEQDAPRKGFRPLELAANARSQTRDHHHTLLQ